MKKIFKLTFIFSLIFLSGCSLNSVKKDKPKEKIKLLLIGEIAPFSPYDNYHDEYYKLMKFINLQNPNLIINTGNFIDCGRQWAKATDSEIREQFSKYNKLTNNLYAPVYPLRGKNEVVAENFYKEYSRKNNYYSFNYGEYHLICLDHSASQEKLKKEQINWLKEDLIANQKEQKTILIFANQLPKNSNSPIFQSLHSLFLQYPVKAVISTGQKFKMQKTDKICYIYLKFDKMSRFTNNHKKVCSIITIDQQIEIKNFKFYEIKNATK